MQILQSQFHTKESIIFVRMLGNSMLQYNNSSEPSGDGEYYICINPECSNK